MSLREIARRALGLKPTIKPPSNPAPTQQQIEERLAWMRSPQYQAVRRATFARMGVHVENAQQQNEPGEQDWLRSGQGR